MFHRYTLPFLFKIKTKTLILSTGFLSFGVYQYHNKSYQLQSLIPNIVSDSNDKEGIKEKITGVIYKKALSMSYPDQGSDADKSHLLHLVGLGVRQVTFMYISAYTMGLYIDENTRQRLLSSSMWKQEYTPEKLKKGNPQSKWFLSNLLEKGNGLSLVLETVRNTDAPHLRNGFVRLLNNRLYQTKGLSKEESNVILSHIDEFKSQFPTGSFKTGQRIYCTRLPNGYLRMEFPDSKTNVPVWDIKNELIANWFFEGYLNAESPISPLLYESVSCGLHDLNPK